MNNIFEEIKQRFEKIRKGTQTFKFSEGTINCPVCHECPFCYGDSEVEDVIYDYDEYAAGIQVFGIGDDLTNLEDFIKHARTDIPLLLRALELACNQLAVHQYLYQPPDYWIEQAAKEISLKQEKANDTSKM